MSASKAMYCLGSALVMLVLSLVAFADNPNDPPPFVPPPTYVNISLLERDYKVLTKAFAHKDSDKNGIVRFHLNDEVAQRLMLGLFNELEGTRVMRRKSK